MYTRGVRNRRRRRLIRLRIRIKYACGKEEQSGPTDTQQQTACRNYNTEECRKYLATRKKSLQENETCTKKNEKLLHISCSVEAEPGKYWRESTADSLDKRQNL
jgi:hypothetical protein